MRKRSRNVSAHEASRVVIIGAGHNGLTTACYLARAGFTVTVLEASARVGGMTSSYAALPEYPDHLLSAASIDAVYWRASSVETDLGLRAFGLSFVDHDPAWAWLGADGESLVFQQNVQATVDDISRFSEKDARTYRDFAAAARKVLAIQDRYGSGGAGRLRRDTFGALVAGLRDSSARTLIASALTKSAAEVIDGLYESAQMRGAFAAMGNILGSITADGSGIAALATAPLHRYGVGRAVGGMQAIPNSLHRCLIAHGGVVRLDAEVEHIDVENGQVSGVALTSGERVSADIVVASCAPQVTGTLLNRADVPASRVLRYAPANSSNIGCFKVDMALDGILTLPRHTRSDGVDMRKPTLMFGTFEQVLEAEAQSRLGETPDDPPWWATILSATDPTQAPRGQDVLYLYAPTPVHPTTDWTTERERVADGLVTSVSQVISGIDKYELGRVIETPADLQQRLRAPNGCIYHVDQSITRLGPARPGLGWGPGDAAVRGLFLGGAGTHPSGGVSGIPGKLAAESVLSACTSPRSGIRR